MDSNGNGATCILDLPAELIELIVEQGNFEAMLNLRLTCRDLEAKSDHIFVRTNFMDRQFYVESPSSMAVLLGISKNRRLARRMTCISFSLAQLQKPYLDWLARPGLNSYPYKRTDRDVRAKHRTYRKNFGALYTEHEKYRAGRALEELTAIFKNFKEHDSIPCVLASSYDSGSNGRPAAYGSMRTALGYDKVMVPSIFRETPALVWKAMNAASFPVTRLLLGSRTQALPLAQLEVLLNNPSERLLTTQLERLNLNIWTQGSSTNTDDGISWIAGLFSLIVKAPNLVLFSLSLDEQGACKDFHTVLVQGLCYFLREHGSFAKLRVLELDGIQVDALSMEYFALKLRRALYTFCVKNIPVWEESHVAVRKVVREVLLADEYPNLVTVEISEEWTRREERKLDYTTWRHQWAD